MRSRHTGFTLLEVLIALAILAISATAIVRQTGNSLVQLAELESKTTANLLAEAQVDKIVAGEGFPSTGRSSERVTLNGREWSIRTQVSGTSEPWLRRIEVAVSDSAVDDYPLAVLVAYRGRY